ncbi:YmaF family protein [Paenibacillus caui]|uniref:YmaF family protein n=1 Tax=Paenibacillus caui TaxID=2873927 RepID=UPI001CA8F4E2|nr:YmaF family protein [Paenibacillus caui]
MEIPITGLIIHSDDSDDFKDSESRHLHKLYITSWNGRQVHTHPFSGNTSYDDGHSHYYVGMTDPAPNGVQHVHSYQAKTSFNNGHSHTIRGTTGPAIPLPTGGHYHYFRGYTTIDGIRPHRHEYRGNTGNETQ